MGTPQAFLRRAIITTCVLAITPLSVGYVSASTSTARESTTGPLSSWACVSARGDAGQIDAVSEGTQPQVTFSDGWVANTSSSWRQVHPSNGSFTLRFYSLGWVVPEAGASADEITMAVERVLDFHLAIPDSGSKALAEGWSEAATAKRIRVVDCLYQVSADQRLVAIAQALAEAVIDPNRYYGPPRFPAHNHGVMADRALLSAAETFDRRDWADVAIRRLRGQLNATFDSCGMTGEQASTYQHFHAQLWTDIADRVRPFDQGLTIKISQAVASARRMADLLTFPDGRVPVIGDGGFREGAAYSAGNSLTWCPDTGWGVLTRQTRSGVSQHAVARFGPGTRFHGHSDKGSFTWWVGDEPSNGVIVVTDRGLFGKNRDHRLTYARGPEAHSTLLWAGGSDVPLAGRVREKSRGRVNMTLVAERRVGSWKRALNFSRTATPTVVVRDRVRGKAAAEGAVALFPLDPIWREVSSTSAGGLFTTDTGWQLSVSCSHKSGSATLSVTQAEHFPAYRVAEDALTVSCQVPGGKTVDMVSTLRVFPPSATPNR